MVILLQVLDTTVVMEYFGLVPIHIYIVPGTFRRSNRSHSD